MKTLSASNVAEDLHLVREGNINMTELDSNIQTISNDEIGNNEQRHHLSKIIRQPLSDLSIHNTF